jgi:hypothetical protein
VFDGQWRVDREVNVRSRASISFVSTLAFLLVGGALRAQGLPTCRVRVVRSAATEAVAKSVASQVEGWVNVRERGCRLESSIDDADVLLEFSLYQPTTLADGTPGEKWMFIARRLSEPNRQRATYRFGYLTMPDPRTRAHVAEELPIVLGDVCLGYLPKVAGNEGRR